MVQKISSLTGLGVKDARNLERGVFNWTINFCEEKNIVLNWQNEKFKIVYVDKSRSVVCNLNQNSYLNNDRLLVRMQESEFGPYDLPFMARENVFPERWSKYIDGKIKRDSLVLNEKPQAMTNEFRCGKCHKRECVYIERQTRSGDEATSLFICCLGCGHRWKIN